MNDTVATRIHRGARGLALCLLLVAVACDQPSPPPAFSINDMLGDDHSAGFARATEIRAFEFPRDHGAHESFRNEWWYITGQLNAGDRHFGYQITLFRIALAPQPPTTASPWATNTVWMAHVALTDTDNGVHHARELISRDNPGLAGASLDPFVVWVEGWQIAAVDGNDFPWRVSVDAGTFTLDLTLSPIKPIVLQGDRGRSQKSATPSNASYYYSLTRLQTDGALTVNGESHRVSGWSWLDREWSTSALAEDQQGWDWFSLQFDSGEELMYYQLRDRAGAAHAFSQGMWVAADGTYSAIAPSQLTLKPLRYWQAEDGARYPVEWELTHGEKTWRVTANMDDQLLRLSVRYWEGAIAIYAGDRRVGRGYLEMTGY